MEERSEVEKMDEIMLPGFRFHPTDEELVGFYLKRKVQQRPLSIELIKQLDIYKYDPWDLPKLAAIGEKEWYFYCPRDRKYRNSTRPNRVTGAGFWKATGTDRPIYSSEGSKCIGLKKSLVFYKGRAAKGIKTDWMMHEFRLPSLTDSAPQKRFLERSIPANDSWAICRIFKKTNTSAQRAVSHSWVSPLPQTTTSDILPQLPLSTHFTSENMSPPAKSNSSIQFSSKNDLQNLCVTTNFSPSYFPSSKPQISLSNENYVPFNCLFPNETSKSIVDASSMLQNMSSSIFGDFNRLQDQQCNGFSITLPQEMQQNGNHIEEQKSLMKDLNGEIFEVNDQWGIMGCSGLPLGLASAWKSNLVWDNSSPCPSEISTNYSTNKCYM